jgi:hypothetical protein
MLYVLHCSFSQETDATEDADSGSHGYFTCLQDATDVDDAISKTKTLIRRLHGRDLVFSSATEIYLESCTEVRKLPEGGLLTRWTSERGYDACTIACDLPGAPKRAATAYGQNLKDGVLEPLLSFASVPGRGAITRTGG